MSGYWDGVETVAGMDLGLLNRVVETIAKAKETAAKSIGELERRSHAADLPFVPHDLGPDLTRLYLRVFRVEFRRLATAQYVEAQDRWWRIQEGNETLGVILRKIDEQWPQYAEPAAATSEVR